MAKRKRTKRQTTLYKNKISSKMNPGELRCFRRVSSSCSTSATYCVTLVKFVLQNKHTWWRSSKIIIWIMRTECSTTTFTSTGWSPFLWAPFTMFYYGSIIIPSSFTTFRRGITTIWNTYKYIFNKDLVL